MIAIRKRAFKEDMEGGLRSSNQKLQAAFKGVLRQF